MTECARDAMLVLDGSASMSEIGFDASAPTRIDEARAALAQAMPRIAQVRRVGLLTYGPGGADACSGIDLHFGPIDGAAGPIIAAAGALRPGGLTPLAASVQAAAEALRYRTTPGIVVLVTDGNETCGGRPCALGTALAAQGAALTVHVIGFRVQYDPFAWDNPEAQTYDGGAVVAKCLSDRTGGLYVDTQTVDELAEALETVLGCAVVGRLPDDRPSAG
jgi:Ca-activated chloride channel family protein